MQSSLSTALVYVKHEKKGLHILSISWKQQILSFGKYKECTDDFLSYEVFTSSIAHENVAYISK